MMNHYKFPLIRNIHDVLPYIADRKEFVVAQKDGYSVINYVVSMEDTFPPVTSHEDIIKRECRGMIFDAMSGDILARRYHKFFNVGEREETSPQFVDLSKDHVILEKLDGSMITPFYVGAKLRWGTKMGVTDTSLPVEDYVQDYPQYLEFAALVMSCGYTPIFEWCSRKQKIVLDYNDDKLILTALRRTKEGDYTSYLVMKAVAEYSGIPVVKAMESKGQDIRVLTEFIRAQEGTEGVVIRFDDGHMLKLKSEWYVQLHHAKDVTKFEKNVLEIILEDKLDDLLPLLEEPYRTQVQEYNNTVHLGMLRVTMRIKATFNDIMAKMQSKEKREFAVHHVKQMEDKALQPFMFALWDGKNSYDMIKAELLKGCSSQNRLDNVRWMMDNVAYNVSGGNYAAAGED